MVTFTSKVEFLRQVFGNISVARDGVNVAVKCPVCDESEKKKFSINTETWQCHCWVCGIKGGNPYKIFKEHIGEDVAIFFKDRFLKEKFNHQTDTNDTSLCVELPSSFLPLFINSHHSDPDVKNCLTYLRNRGITHRDLWYFKLGTAVTGKFRRRIIIPSFDSEGSLNYFSSRSIDDNSKFKYVNSKASKSKIIFNEINVDWNSEITIAEGPFDLFKSNQNATCLLGSGINENSYLFKRIVANKTPVLLALDSDMRSKTIKIAKLLMDYDCKVRIINLGSFSDVGEMTKEKFEEAREKAALWSRLSSIKERISSIRTGSLL